MSFKSTWQRAQQQGRDLLDRGLDRHIRIAVTGLSGAGKTAFITSFIDQLRHAAEQPQYLRFWRAAAQAEVESARLAAQPDWTVPRFDYEAAIACLELQRSTWPTSTNGLSEIRIELNLASPHGWRARLGQQRRYVIDVLDYPGEWLLDLPLLSQTYDDWSQQQAKLFQQAPRAQLSQAWQQQLRQTEWANDSEGLAAQIRKLAADYRQLLQDLRQQHGVYWLQPGRALLPAEYAAAPVLDFFPWLGDWHDSASAPPRALLAACFERYKAEVVEPFYRQHFRRFNRQVMLVDILGAMERGPAAFADLRLALQQLMPSFRYGHNHLLRRLFQPHIERVAFVASKADYLLPEQQQQLSGWLKNIVEEAIPLTDLGDDVQHAQFNVAAIRSTEVGQSKAGEALLRGVVANGAEQERQVTFRLDALPTNVTAFTEAIQLPKLLPYFPQSRRPLPHARMDQFIEFILAE